ncbi:hypothetical protein K5D56_04235 [Pseudomonas cichorii]|nr:hypothetical protein [Pseudomonas cichorii]
MTDHAAALSFYVVISTKGKISFAKDAVYEQQFRHYGFHIGPEISGGNCGLYRVGNRVALLFSNKADRSEYLSTHGSESTGFPSELLGWWFV